MTDLRGRLDQQRRLGDVLQVRGVRDILAGRSWNWQAAEQNILLAEPAVPQCSEGSPVQQDLIVLSVLQAAAAVRVMLPGLLIAN